MSAPKPAVSVSDHAVLRWLERVEGIDVEAVRQEIADIAAEPAARGMCYFDWRDDIVLTLDGYRVATVMRKAPRTDAHLNGRRT